MTPRRTSLVAVGAVVLTLALAACSGSAAPTGIGSTNAPLPANSSPVAGGSGAPAAPVEAGDVAEHVHNLVVDGQDIYLGTHEGLFRQSPGQPLTRISDASFDVMGLVKAEGVWFASGHPGDGMDAPSDLGLVASTDGGVTWEPRSLSGNVDFHRLATSGNSIMGLSAHDGALLSSSDNGSTWTDMGRPLLFDLAVSPQDPALVVGTTPDGPVTSADGGKTFTPITGAPLLALLSWDDTDLYAVDPAGQVLVSTDTGKTWTQRGSVAGQPMAAAASAGNVAVLVNGTVYFSTDSGATFSPRITGLAGH